MKLEHLFTLLLALVLFVPAQNRSQDEVRDEVKTWEESLVLPTYLTGPPDPFPIFYNGRAYQGAQGRVYPYPILDSLSDKKEDVAYTALYLENRYLKISVLPELGGRIFSALDKTNDYNIFYRQSVIKPALIGMLGAWISGGVEWNIPHHHRATSFMPVHYALKDNPDGSKTIWIGELELRHRMTWSLGLTLYPGRSYLEATIHIINRTPYPHGMLCWANVAVHTNENYQVIFPPDTQFATFHGKNQFAHWPISTETYNRTDYSGGVDISWWKNHPAPTSFFAWDCQENFLAGYDHARRAGVLHWADHHTVPGKKFWTWGTGTQGKRWETILSDSDGPYLELMVGAYSDNQPDYSWIKPYEIRTVKQYWYPIRDLGGVKAANLEAALELKVVDGYKAVLAVNTTSPRPDLEIVLKATEEPVFETQISVSPDVPFSTEVELADITDPPDLELILTDQGKPLLSYRPQVIPNRQMPAPVGPPSSPQEISSIEELCLTGQRLEQFYNPSLDPLPYYKEALRRDPGDSHVNTTLGVYYLKRGMFEVAENRLRTALARLTRNYTSPQNGEAFYYLGVALRNQERLQEAEEAFQAAAWDSGWRAASHYALAEISCLQGDLEAARSYLLKAPGLTAPTARYAALKAVLLRKQGRYQEALTVAAEALHFDPLNFWVQNEVYLSFGEQEFFAEASRVYTIIQNVMGDNHQAYLELAIDYGNCGFYDEAVQVLERFMSKKEENVPTLLVYYLGYYLNKLGKNEEALKTLKSAAMLPPLYCFPFRHETIEVLQHALNLNPVDSHAFYYLGNCLFESQPEMAIAYWERARSLNERYFMIHRNLGLAYARIQNDVTKAVASLEVALALLPKSPRILCELDQMYGAAGVDPHKRLKILEDNHDVAEQRDDTLMREIELLVQLGQYDRAIDIMEDHHFHVWEGGGHIHNLFVDAHLLKGNQYMEQDKFERALGEFLLADTYPANLEVGRPVHGGRSPQVQYCIGWARQRLGQQEAARKAYEQSAAFDRGWSALSYYKAMSLRNLGRPEEAAAAFEGLRTFALDRIANAPPADFFAKFGEQQSAATREAQSHYLLGLAYLGQGKMAEADTEMARTIELNPNHYWAQSLKQTLKRD